MLPVQFFEVTEGLCGNAGREKDRAKTFIVVLQYFFEKCRCNDTT